HDDAEEAELRSAQGRTCAPDQWLRSGELHRRRGAQPAGALGGSDPGRPGEGFAWCALSHGTRSTGYLGRGCSPPGALQVRCQEAQVVANAIGRSNHMARRAAAPRREILPDPRYQSELLAKFMNMIMRDGKKSRAEAIVYGALAEISTRKGTDEPLEVLEEA